MTDAETSPPDGDANLLADLLLRTSRTFALAIPCLPANLRPDVTVAYLLFRVADTFEDSTTLNANEKLSALNGFAGVLNDVVEHRQTPEMAAAACVACIARRPSDNPEYLALLDELPSVLAALAELDPTNATLIVDYTQTSIEGMQRFVASGASDGTVHVRSLAELRDYCYVVAGLVGELLTDLFIHATDSLAGERECLHADARWFGEGLQLVNILKDSDDDARDGRVFIPQVDVTRSQLFELARADLAKAERYVSVLRQASAPAGVIAFAELPLRLAWRTLECVEQDGPGSKVPRDETLEILMQVLGPLAMKQVSECMHDE